MRSWVQIPQCPLNVNVYLSDFLSTISGIRTKYVIESNGAEGDRNVIQRGFARGAHVSESRVCRLNKMAGTVGSVVRALAGIYVATSQLLDYFVENLIRDRIYSHGRRLDRYSREATPAFWVSRIMLRWSAGKKLAFKAHNPPSYYKTDGAASRVSNL